MSTLLAPSTVLPSLLDDNDFEFPGSLLNNDFWARPSRVFNAPFFRNGGLPAVNVKDTGKSFDRELAGPGNKKEDLKVNVTDGVLTVASEMKKETEDEKNGYMRREFNYRSKTPQAMMPR